MCVQVLAPSQASVVQGLPSAVQGVPCGSNWSAGQTVLAPVQLSARSQTPAEARHTAPALPAGCWHAPTEPLHWSSVQGLPSSAQAVPDGLITSAGQVVLEPVQVSAGSHTPVEARHTVPALPAGC